MVKPNDDPPTDFSVIGPEHDRARMKLSDFERAEVVPGYRYELVDGELQVAPGHLPRAAFVQSKLFDEFVDNRRRSNAAAELDCAIPRPRVIVSASASCGTNIEPDIGVYRKGAISVGSEWSDINPVLVIEVVDPEGVDKDYLRNVNLYECVSEILEYWIVDPTEAWPPVMVVFRRSRGTDAFERVDLPPDSAYASSTWPGLTVCPSKWGLS